MRKDCNLIQFFFLTTTDIKKTIKFQMFAFLQCTLNLLAFDLNGFKTGHNFCIEMVTVFRHR